MTRLVQIGDVVKSREFSFGGTFRDGVLPVGFSREEHVRDELTGQWHNTGRLLPSMDCRVQDESRAGAEYVVIRTNMQGGRFGYGPSEVYPPDGWNVRAQRLAADGTFDPQGEVIEFYQSGAFTNMARDLEVVRKMKQTFVDEQPSRG